MAPEDVEEETDGVRVLDGVVEVEDGARVVGELGGLVPELVAGVRCCVGCSPVADRELGHAKGDLV